ncbi:olfactory receptor 5B2 [Fukomys damarensis]|uniref:olfactory receptor 5B2 n=1 Tax=Fukomys damarensis TaxID=885580 RepID=UPI0008FEF421|nr:olfactory receptor 5B2 [Fukomys damarensis]
MENRTEVTEFLLLGLTDDPHLRLPLFITFLLIYTLTMAGNLGMLLLILLDPRLHTPMEQGHFLQCLCCLIYTLTMAGNLGMLLLILLDPRLHTPMYCFLGNLSLVDFCYSSVVTPSVMAGLLTGNKVISYNACAAQMFLFTTLSTGLVMGCYVLGFLNACIHTGEAFSQSFCSSNMIHHFFCDVPPVMALSCSDKQVTELVLVYDVSFHILFAILVITTSYVFIFGTILRMRSPAGHLKALSTCASHFTAVSIFYGTTMFMYLQPSSSHSMDTAKIASVFYTMVIPMLNPMVYSLRNKEVKSAFLKVKHALIYGRPSRV